jgi:hypothetical protein
MSKRWHGLALLVRDAVEHGTRAAEKVHLGTVGRTFTVLEHIPKIDAPAKVVHVVHDAYFKTMYGAIRVVNQVVGVALDVALKDED